VWGANLRGHPPENVMSSFTAKVKHEFVEMLPPTIFFFIILHIVAIIRSLMTRDSGIELPTVESVTIAALVLGKSVLIANMLPFVNRFPEKPLAWNVAWKTVIYALVALVIHYFERLYDYWKDAHSFAAANRDLLAHLNWAHFLAVQILLITLIIGYCILAELSRVIGRRRFITMFFGPLPSGGPASQLPHRN
jgi:hypothetical protein